MEWNRQALADLISEKIVKAEGQLRQQYRESAHRIGYFFIDDLLPQEVAFEIYQAFPDPSQMVHKKSIREDKFVAAQMDRYAPLLEEAIYAFQDARVVAAVSRICDIRDARPDENLYAGGISAMGKGQYLNPHLDNSHDKERELWRVLNLLYYVTPDWEAGFGANLELWPDGMDKPQITIHSKFNRLAVMATHNASLHSVSPVVHDGLRCCVSNYYFSPEPLQPTDTFHVTSFRGRPENKLTDIILRADAFLRMKLRSVFKKGIRENPHVYKKKN